MRFLDGRPGRNLLVALPLSFLFWGVYTAAVPLVLEQPYTNENTITLPPGETVEQSFLARYPGLSEVGVRIQPGGDVTIDQLQLELRQDDPDETGETALQVVPSGTATGGGWLSFPLVPIQSAAPTRFTMALKNVSDQPAVLPIETRNLYPAGGLRGRSDDLAFRATFHPPYLVKIRFLLQNLARGKPGLLGWPPWYAILGLMMTTVGFSAILAAFTGRGHEVRESPPNDGI